MATLAVAQFSLSVTNRTIYRFGTVACFTGYIFTFLFFVLVAVFLPRVVAEPLTLKRASETSYIKPRNVHLLLIAIRLIIYWTIQVS